MRYRQAEGVNIDYMAFSCHLQLLHAAAAASANTMPKQVETEPQRPEIAKPKQRGQKQGRMPRDIRKVELRALMP
jgi:hypothetical protein